MSRPVLRPYACPACKYSRFNIAYEPQEGYAEIRCDDCGNLILMVPAGRLDGVKTHA